MKCSACWIVKNEEKNILRSIGSVKNAVDELVVIDTGSTDNTVKISRESGAVVEYFEWTGDFSAARNYALDRVSGDIVFFLDADEWFEPALTPEDRKQIERIFSSDPEVRAIQLTINNLNSKGAVKISVTGNRILRKAPDTCFKKKIHEVFAYKNGAMPYAYVSPHKWVINHSGYVEEIFESKMSRNINMLEKAASLETDPGERHFQYCYLVREYFQIKDFQEALRCLKLVLSEPDLIRKHCITYGYAFAPLLYSMLGVARKMRGHVSRRELQRKIVDTFKRNLTVYPGSATIELYFEALFSLKDDMLLARIEPAMDAIKKIPESQISSHRDSESAIYSLAAQAAFRQGRLSAAMEYAVQAFKHSENRSPFALSILLNCLKGQPASEIILFLNSQFDLDNPQTLEFVSTGTRMYGFRDVHAYYLDRRVKAEIATKGDYLYLLLLYGKYAETVKMASQIHDGETADTVLQIFFLAAVCSGNEDIFNEYKAIMGEYSDLLESYFSGKPLETVTDGQLRILNDNFHLIAFAAGIKRADAFSEIFSSEEKLIYMLRTQYCIDNGLFELALSKELPEESDCKCKLLAVKAMTMAGRLDEAFGLIKSQLDSGYADEVILNYLLAVSERAAGALKAESRALYDKYIALYDKLVDLRDILNTGYVVDDSEKKKAKALKSLTTAQFKKLLAEDAKNPQINGGEEVFSRAGEFFAEKAMPAAALECYRLALAAGADKSESYKNMSALFGKIGNAPLAKALTGGLT